MTKRNLLLVSLLLVFGLGVTVPSALAQAVLTATTTVYTMRANSDAEAVGPIYLNWVSGAGNISAGQTFNVIYSQPIVGAAGVGGSTGPVADFCISTAPVACTALTVTASGDTLTLTSPSAVTGGFAKGTIEMYGVRINTSAVLPGATINATVYTSVSSTAPFTFSNGTNSISTIVGTVASTSALTVSGPSSPGTTPACYPISPGLPWSVKIAENWAGAWTSMSDELSLAPYLVTNGSEISIMVTGIPLGVTVTPSAPTDVHGTQTWGTLPAAYTGAVFNDSNTFDFILLATNRTTPVAPESATFTFTLTSTGPLQPDNPPMAVSVQLNPAPSASSPVYPAFSYPVVGLSEEAPGKPINEMLFIDCTTPLLYPYVTNFVGKGLGALANWDTGIEVANMTSVPFPTTSTLYTVPINGSCTFYFYNAGTSTTVGTGVEATPVATFVTPVVNSGGIYAFMLSGTKAAGLPGGYAVAVCNFLNGTGYAEVVDNANGLGNWQVMASYLAQVYSAPF